MHMSKHGKQVDLKGRWWLTSVSYGALTKEVLSFTANSSQSLAYTIKATHEDVRHSQVVTTEDGHYLGKIKNNC